MDLPTAGGDPRAHPSRRASRCVARDTPEPSPLCHEILNARPYAFLDDAPLEERRAQAVQTRRADRAARRRRAGRARRRARSRASRRRRGPIRATPTSCTTRWSPPASSADDGGSPPIRAGAAGSTSLARQRRATRASRRPATSRSGSPPSGCRSCSRRSPGARLRAAHRRAARRAPRATVDARRGARRAAARPRCDRSGRSTAAALGASARPDARTRPTRALLALEAEGVVLRGAFTPDAASGVEWCDRRLLARIHRYTLNRLRAEIEPVTPADFMRFLFAWQHVDAGAPAHRRRRPARGRSRSSTASSSPAGAWERARAAGARRGATTPSMLDMLCLDRRGRRGRGSRRRTGGRPAARSVRATPSRCSCASTPTRGCTLARDRRRDRARARSTAQRPARARCSTACARAARRSSHELTSALRADADDVQQRARRAGRAPGSSTSDGFAGLRAMLVRVATRDAHRRPRRDAARAAASAGGRWSLLARSGDAAQPRGRGRAPGADPAAPLRRRVPAAARARAQRASVARAGRASTAASRRAARFAAAGSCPACRASSSRCPTRSSGCARCAGRRPIGRHRDHQRRRSAEPGRHRHRRRSRRAPSRARASPIATACRSRCWKATTSASCTTTSRRRRGRSPARSPDVVRRPSSAASSARAEPRQDGAGSRRASCRSASRAMHAVSVRRMRGPMLTMPNPWRVSRSSSKSFHPPSGPDREQHAPLL